MNDWTAGYVADIGYTFGYYTELNPLRTRLAFLSKGLVFPKIVNACELGFGQGVSINVHAAASSTKWQGTDFNPAQAACAREFSDASGADINAYDEAFSDFVSRPDLPMFDYIGLHGIWSWVSDENRLIIADFIRRKLSVGGVLYVSYNTLPGWAAFAPMRHLMTEHAEVIGSEGRGIISRIDDAIEFADKLLETNPIFSRANPLVSDRIKKLKEQNKHYLAHEYFNRDWHPMHFATMADWLQTAKLSYACSANYLDHIDALNLTADQQTFLDDIPDMNFKESVRDFMVNQQFRRDYWVKGARKLLSLEQAEQIRQQTVVLVKHRQDVSLKVSGSLGEATMTESIYKPILDYLQDHKIRSLGEIEKATEDRGVTLAQVLQATMVLTGAGHVAAAQDASVVAKSKKYTDKLNNHIMNKSKSSNDISYLASPVSGGGHQVSRFQQLFIVAMRLGSRNAVELADFTWQVLKAQGQSLLKDGNALKTDNENITELKSQASEFLSKQVPILKALQIM